MIYHFGNKTTRKYLRSSENTLTRRRHEPPSKRPATPQIAGYRIADSDMDDMALAFLAVEAIMLLSFHLSVNRASIMRFHPLTACLLFLSACSSGSEKIENKVAPPTIRTDDVQMKADAQTSKKDDGDDEDDNAPKPLGDVGDKNFLPNAFCLKIVDKENAIVNVTYRKYYVHKGKRHPLMSKPVDVWITGLSTENVKEYTAWDPRCEFMVIGWIEDKHFGTIRQIAPIVAGK